MRVPASSAASGSSSSSAAGSVARARASATRWAWPPDSARGLAPACVGDADPVEQVRGRGPGGAGRLALRTRGPKATLSRAVRCGNSR